MVTTAFLAATEEYLKSEEDEKETNEQVQHEAIASGRMLTTATASTHVLSQTLAPVPVLARVTPAVITYRHLLHALHNTRPSLAAHDKGK